MENQKQKMFVNNLKIENESGFSLLVGKVSINLYDIYSDKIIISGEISANKELLLNKQIISRIVLVNNETDYLNLLNNQTVLTPKSFLYKDSELKIDETLVSQRIITDNNFKFEVPYQSDLINTKVLISFVASYEAKNQINYYESSLFTVNSSDLIISKEVSNKTALSVILEDKFLLDAKTATPHKQELYLSEIFYNLDTGNNFSANVFYNIQNFFKSKIFFNNLVNYPDFGTYFKNNYIVSINPFLSNGNFILPLAYQTLQDVVLESGKPNDSLILSSDNIDTSKFNNSSLTLDFTYNECSVSYITDSIIPYLTNLSNDIKIGINTNTIIDLLVFYKLIKENYSFTESVNRILDYKNSNPRLLLTNDNLHRISQLISFTKDKYIKRIRDVSANNLANTKFIVNSEQQLDLQFTNARLTFVDITSNSTFPTYKISNFNESFSKEVTKFFGTPDPTVDGTTLDYNTLQITYSPVFINLENTQTYNNNFDFTAYNSASVDDSITESVSFDFSKVFSFFSLGRQLPVVNSYDFQKLLKNNLSANNIVVREIPVNTKNIARFAVTKRDNQASYVSFPANLKNDSCVDSSNFQVPKSTSERRSSEEIPENLFNNISANYAFKDSALYSKNYTTVSASADFPVQVLYPYTQFKNRENSLFQEKEPVAANSKLFSIFYTNFKLIAKVEYMEDLSDGMFTFWKPLTFNVLNKLTTSQKILCRFSFYRNSELQIKEQSFDQFSIYNRHFYLEA